MIIDSQNSVFFKTQNNKLLFQENSYKVEWLGGKSYLGEWQTNNLSFMFSVHDKHLDNTKKKTTFQSFD